ncbi:serine acetyltransferase [Robertmurraya korlensis]|uniref:serine O-acetyltransferase n=1 Tax=Robertmurraya korlensis TaxID=519977 RepID=UPI00203FDEDB|nr:serine acetyltransferase [Robertmurraya korlensis]MCM3600624.1 serine acetyltransferase [Robertmurraya korlensis]
MSNPIVNFLLDSVRHYNHKKYWKKREEVINPASKIPKFIRFIYMLQIKRMDTYHCSSMGTAFGYGTKFNSFPNLPHGLNGIIISHYAKIGTNCTIYQQVTIAESKDGKAAIIGDNCLIGAGAKIIGDVKIGKNVKIGANAVVLKDIPDNCTVVGVPAKVIKKDGVKVAEIENNRQLVNS